MYSGIKETRRLNASYLAEKYGRDAFATKLGMDDTNYINQIVKGHTKIGDKKAADIEEVFSLPKYWMDQVHPTLWLEGATANEEQRRIIDQVLSGLTGRELSLLIESAARLISSRTD